MSTIIEHVRHRVGEGGWDAFDDRILWTRCGVRFIPAHPVYQRRDIAHHEPATSRCDRCYPEAT